MAHNVPVINDDLPARIRACEARPGLVNCGGAKQHKGRYRPTAVLRSPSRLKAAKRL
jgi:hypothetical protein